MPETPQEIVDRTLREFKRYSGDGMPGEPVNAPLPVGDPASGPHNPKKKDLRAALLAALLGAGVDAERAKEEADRAFAEANRAETEADRALGYADNWESLQDAVDHAQEWAQSPDPISEDAGGDGATDRSAKWWAERFKERFRQTWSDTENYLEGETVQFDGDLWIALQNNTNSEPTEGADWTLLLSGSGIDQLFTQDLTGDYTPGQQEQARENIGVGSNTTPFIFVTDFGAIGDGDTANGPVNQQAFQEAVDHIVSLGGGTLLVPDGVYIVDGPIDIWRAASPRIDLMIKGQSQWNTKILTNFYGAGEALFQCYDPDDTVRTSPTSFEDLFLAAQSTAGGVNPVMIRIRGWGESRINRVRFGATNNTQISTSSMQNIRGSDLTAFYGGKSYAYKDTTGITFTLSGTTLTASAPIFSSSAPNDAGRIVTLMSTSRQKVTIASVTNSTTVTVSGDRLSNVSGVDAIFEGGVATINSGSNQLAGSPGQNIFAPEDVGRIVYVARAYSGNGGALGVLRATITEYINTHAVRLDKNADLTATNTRFSTPAFDFYAGSPTSTGPGNDINSSDNKFDKVQIESYAGIGLGLYNMRDANFTDCKIHGVTTMTSERAAYAAIWGQNLQGTFSGQLDSSCASGRERIYLSDFNKTFTFPYLFSRNIINEKHFTVEAFGGNPDGYVVVENFEAVQYGTSIEAMFNDQNTRPRLLFTGLINMLGDASGARVGLGFNMKAGDGFVQMVAPVDVGSIPNGGIAITAAGNLVYRNYAGTLRTVSFT